MLEIDEAVTYLLWSKAIETSMPICERKLHSFGLQSFTFRPMGLQRGGLSASLASYTANVNDLSPLSVSLHLFSSVIPKMKSVKALTSSMTKDSLSQMFGNRDYGGFFRESKNCAISCGRRAATSHKNALQPHVDPVIWWRTYIKEWPFPYLTKRATH